MTINITLLECASLFGVHARIGETRVNKEDRAHHDALPPTFNRVYDRASKSATKYVHTLAYPRIARRPPTMTVPSVMTGRMYISHPQLQMKGKKLNPIVRN